MVFADEDTLQDAYRRLTKRPATQFELATSSVSTVRGFYDFSTNTLYCSRMDFATCGHELHHAALGRYHHE